jgi:hypothetical protein
MATAKKRTKKKSAAKKALTWGKGVVHPVTKRPCGGRPMSQRDMKLFTKMGKRRAGVTPTKVKEAYGLKSKAAPKRKTAPKRKVTGRKPLRKTAAKRSTPKRRMGSPVKIYGCPVQCQRYVVVDGSMRYQSSHKLLSAARKKQAALEAKSPRKVFRIVDTK